MSPNPAAQFGIFSKIVGLTKWELEIRHPVAMNLCVGVCSQRSSPFPQVFKKRTAPNVQIVEQFFLPFPVECSSGDVLASLPLVGITLLAHDR